MQFKDFNRVVMINAKRFKDATFSKQCSISLGLYLEMCAQLMHTIYISGFGINERVQGTFFKWMFNFSFDFKFISSMNNVVSKNLNFETCPECFVHSSSAVERLCQSIGNVFDFIEIVSWLLIWTNCALIISWNIQKMEENFFKPLWRRVSSNRSKPWNYFSNLPEFRLVFNEIGLRILCIWLAECGL